MPLPYSQNGVQTANTKISVQIELSASQIAELNLLLKANMDQITTKLISKKKVAQPIQPYNPLFFNPSSRILYTLRYVKLTKF